jgi:DNA (cytosine-5)-methyltransferase 1
LASLGYDAEWQIVSAAAIGAPHLRERIFVVAYPSGHGLEGGVFTATPRADGPEASPDHRGAVGAWSYGSPNFGVGYGLPDWVDRLRALGNAVVPQVAEFVGRLILEAEGAASAA